MNRRLAERRLFTRRAFIVSGFKAVVGVSIISRLAYLQIFRAQHYKLLSDKNRIVSQQIIPARGNILDSQGKPLAVNKNSYSVFWDMMDTKPGEREEVALKIIKEFPNLDEDVTAKLQTIDRSTRFILLQENVDWDTLAAFYILSSKIPGVNVEKNLTRHYLSPEIFAHVIGYTGTPTKSDLENSDNTALALPTAKIGRCCIERGYNETLFGKTGIKNIEVNSRRQFVRLIDEIREVPGEDIKLTINKNLQEFVYNRLSNEESAACVVMNIHTGAILSFVSYPGYDNNIFNSKIDKAVLNELYKNPYKPMINKVVSGLYSPGSTFKMITALAGLSKGVITRYTTFHCSGEFSIGRYKYHCWRWKYNGHGSVNLVQAIAQSCDVYFYNVAMMLSPDDIAKVANDFGLGVPTNIDMTGEVSGLIPTKSWKKNKRKQPWTKGDTVNMSIGQGFSLSTPLQLARMVSILVNGMNPITPYLCSLKKNIGNKLNYKKEHIDLIMEGMENVINDPRGTAYKARIIEGDFDFAGKTGSSQVVRITEKQRHEFKTVSDDYWKKEHALFVGYAPSDTPEIAICVLVEHGGGGSSKAAPIARDVFLEANKLRIFL
ncbi:MAG: penicillin-binding protein 2 [Holosporales bacterium]|jgi:penicillin-binding protein 2|nr:penicillin-binding protein 2 [Holosporales bacterium]